MERNMMQLTCLTADDLPIMMLVCCQIMKFPIKLMKDLCLILSSVFSLKVNTYCCIS